MKFDEAKILRSQLKKFQAELPRMTDLMLTVAVTHSTENFAKQGYDDLGVKKWAPRQRTRTRDIGKAILVQSGRLRRSLRKKRLTALSGVIFSPLPYARRHNEGLDMPQRQFVGNSINMVKKIERALELKINRIFA